MHKKIARIALAAAFISLFAGCGDTISTADTAANVASSAPGGLNLQVVSFGDSLSDVGTYMPIVQSLGGGRFTTNPGEVWTQKVAEYYGGTLTPAFTIAINQSLVAQNGLGYAEGGATVATPAAMSNELVSLLGNVQMPVNAQIASYLQTYTSFNANQLVLVWGGANDVLRAGQSSDAAQTVQTAATTIAQLVDQIVTAGATHVVVANMPNIGLTPSGMLTPDGGATLTQLSQLFNSTLDAALTANNNLTGKIIKVDLSTWLDQEISSYQANGFRVTNTSVACDPTKTLFKLSLFCSPKTFIEPGADQSYMFADGIHPSTHLHDRLALYFEQKIASSGLGR